MSKVCVIDIGSNTIRAVAYYNGEIVSNNAVGSMLFDETKNKLFSAKGIMLLANTINTLCQKSKPCDTYTAFATSAFRDIENQAEVIAQIYELTNVKIKVLSGIDEAECDMLGLTSVTGVKTGVGLDLGGGSFQIFKFTQNILDYSKSYPLGCVRVKNELGITTSPSAKDEEEIRNYISKHFTVDFNTDELFVLGGTSRIGLKIYNKLNDTKTESIALTDFDKMIEYCKTDDGQKLILEIEPYRYISGVVGMITISTIAHSLNADKITVKNCSVRDGFLRKYI